MSIALRPYITGWRDFEDDTNPSPKVHPNLKLNPSPKVHPNLVVDIRKGMCLWKPKLHQKPNAVVT